VLHRARDLADRTKSQSRHFILPSVERARFRNAVPLAKRAFIVEAEFRQRVRDMVFNRVDADAELCGDARIGHAVPDKLDNPPFGGGQLIVMGRASAFVDHDRTLKRAMANYPTSTPCGF